MEFNDTYSHVHFLLEGEIDVLIFFKYIFFPAKETMRITSLSNETFDNLASVLDKDSTIGWKKLMREGFSHIYMFKNTLRRLNRYPALQQRHFLMTLMQGKSPWKISLGLWIELAINEPFP